MLDLAKGQSCQATNFIRCLRLLPSAREAELLEPSKLPLSKRVERMNSYILNEVNKELSAQGNAIIDQMFGFQKQTRRVCLACQRAYIEVHKNKTHCIDLTYVTSHEIAFSLPLICLGILLRERLRVPRSPPCSAPR